MWCGKKFQWLGQQARGGGFVSTCESIKSRFKCNWLKIDEDAVADFCSAELFLRTPICAALRSIWMGLMQLEFPSPVNKKKGKNWCVTVQIELFLKNWSRRAWNKGLEPSSPVLHVLYGLSCVLQRPFTRLVLAQFMYFGIERNWLPQFLLFIFWTVTFKQNEKEKEKNTEIVKLWQWYPWNVVVPCRWHHLFPKINGCRGLHPPLFF